MIDRASRYLCFAAPAATALALLSAGCGGGEQSLSGKAIEPLAARSDEVVARLEAGDSCGARRVAVALRRDAQRLLARNAVQGDAAAELRSRTSSLVRAITCVPPPAPKPAVSAPPRRNRAHQDEEGGDD